MTVAYIFLPILHQQLQAHTPIQQAMLSLKLYGHLLPGLTRFWPELLLL